MKVGMFIQWQARDGISDAEMIRQEIELGVLADELGFDEVWSPEHHFDDYSICPDNIQMLTYLAGRTTNIKLGVGAAILPWHTPLRVAERVAVLDALSNGRMLLGFGRGLSRSEYEGLGVDMAESRDRFDESYEVILRALDTGILENEGPFYPQVRVPLRPALEHALGPERLHGVAMSEGSLEPAAQIGTMIAFIQGPIEGQKDAIETWRAHFRRIHGCAPPPPLLTDHMICHEDPDEAERIAREFMPQFYLEVLNHYEFSGTHFADTKGYEAYAAASEQLRARGADAAVEAFISAQCWGTPEQILEKVHHRRDVIGEYKAGFVFSYGNMEPAIAHRSMKTFAAEVLPELRALDVAVGV